MLSLPDFKEKKVILCFATEGQTVSFKNDNMIIKNAKDEIVLQTSCHKIFSLWIIGHTSLTSGILERSKKFSFSIGLLSYTHRLYGLWNSVTEGNFLLRKMQYDYNKLDLARHIVLNKITNQIDLLKSMRNKSQCIVDNIQKMNEYLETTRSSNELQLLLGLEGVASRLFFKSWFNEMNWSCRRPRTKIDFINTTLDIGYTYLFNFIECVLNLYGFDLYQGVYHRSFFQRKSLVCDIVEPFRCIIDKQIKKAYNLQQMQLEDFEERRGQFFLKSEKNKSYVSWLTKSILEYKENIFNYVQEYYRCFIRGKQVSEYPFFRIIEN